jgi:hypothetical protein
VADLRTAIRVCAQGHGLGAGALAMHVCGGRGDARGHKHLGGHACVAVWFGGLRLACMHAHMHADTHMLGCQSRWDDVPQPIWLCAVVV